MAGRNVFSSMSLIQATITFVVAFLAVNVLIDALVFGVEPTRNIARHIVAAAIAAPLWYFFIRWMRSRNA
jgi:VIT1/CCC1 family predicted Fe2+/Mn2+ transporter